MTCSRTRLWFGLALTTAAISACLLPSLPALAVEVPLDLPLEALLQAEVQTASRKIQRLQDVAAAVFVITRSDIETTGVTSPPEALRLAPGLDVARLANNRWAVSARGFNGRFANKLQVLIDGRSLYHPLFSGVLWENEDTLLEDIERIEVIRGPVFSARRRTAGRSAPRVSAGPAGRAHETGTGRRPWARRSSPAPPAFATPAARRPAPG